jgi:hypothetical protein
VSTERGKLGGNSRDNIYGHLDCYSANKTPPSYAKIRVFFADEDAAIAAIFDLGFSIYGINSIEDRKSTIEDPRS